MGEREGQLEKFLDELFEEDLSAEEFKRRLERYKRLKELA